MFFSISDSLSGDIDEWFLFPKLSELIVVNEINKLTAYITFRVGGIYGGANINPQKQLVYNGLDILVATPGRLMDMILDRTLQLKDIQKLVLDEVDELLSLGFRTQIVQLMEKLPAKRQNLLFSATLDEAGCNWHSQ